ncbi:murein L,D-transpeptidase YcbB/YkuD [Methylopila capsulata]|uniref:Murein L,D-transpeptidase YcbB/YkuD n=1 Tax=Methylopila capsulata TaxID=61654 RepID=A0A9W6MT07_9HYPH|nr:L,D-transpeptidase family protein [Methylopila capsulata]MBM7853461.1 murein L,D-transpeptidase YcbB/YkuD [Methylopila capsulata]GLK57325.1 hypothetical protein GCM10008170_33450 [Methylopila capsulata]
MITSADRGPTTAPTPKRAWRAAALGVSLSALTFAGALAQAPGTTAAVATPEAAQTPAPAPIVPDVTGSVDAAGEAKDEPAAAPAAPDAEQAAPATPGPVEAIHPTDPLQTAVTALLATDGAGQSLKMPAGDRAALIAFYAARNGSPLWLADSRFTPQADAARAKIASAADDGLDPKRYALPSSPASSEPAVVARADVMLSAAALAYAREAWGGRVNPTTISRSIAAGASRFDAAAALVAISASADVATTLDGFNPPHAQFQALRKLLIAKRAERTEAPKQPLILEGKLLKPGVEDERVPVLRARLGLDERPGDLMFDDALAEALSAFQKTKKLPVSGLANRQTIRALNAEGRGADPTSLLVANMERWRWLPRDLGAKHVFVDVAAFELHIMQDGRSIHDTRVIVGKNSNQTPLFSNAIDHIVVNPYWNVPTSIAVKEMLPQLRRDPNYLANRGYEVVVSDGKKTRVVGAGSVDWSGNLRNVRIRQPPGERNALGNIKFMFPNDYAVYLHDTPQRNLFKLTSRALSHGCVRVNEPLQFADALIGDQGWSGEKLGKLVGGKERRVNLATPIPVHLTYFTAWVGADGALQTRSDFYGQDPRLKAALNGEPLPPLPQAAPVVAMPKPEKPVRRAAPPQTQEQQAQMAEQAPVQRPRTFGSWLSNVFGDSSRRQP